MGFRGRIGYESPVISAVHSEAQNRRRSLVATDLLLAEEIIARPELPPRGVTTKRQLAITFAGAFEFQVGRSTSWVDPSRLLFADADQPFVDHHVVPGTGHKSVILTPDANILDEVWGSAKAEFARRIRGCSLRVQMLAQLMRRTANTFAAEEIGIELLGESVADRRKVTAVDPRCVQKAKSVLHECVEGRLTLTEVAADVGVSPIHLTQQFKRSEGMPLYRYQTGLRLIRALDKLPEREDISDLAFELGFSSHSHFTSVFRENVGVTPSSYRSAAVALS